MGSCKKVELAQWRRFCLCPKRHTCLGLLACVLVLGVAFCAKPLLDRGRVGHAGASTTRMFYSEHERFGVNLSQGNLAWYDFKTLGVGWYTYWNIAVYPPHPDGIEAGQLIRTCNAPSGTPSMDDIRAVVAANPGTAWFVGNEPDRKMGQDGCLPEEYARTYHDVYHVIKSVDPTAAVVPGGLVQATPLRMKYLDRVLAAYQADYGQPLPADAWHLHGFILRECVASLPGCWGADIPPGLAETVGELYDMRDVDNMAIFREHIQRFRQWMADHGWRDTPLYIDEYGVLMPDDYFDEDGKPIDALRVRDFMMATFDYFLTTQDPALGYPADENRLVQAWAWYSVNDDVCDGPKEQCEVMGGDLFDCYGGACTLSVLGQAYADYATPLVTPYVDLYPLSLRAEANSAWLGAIVPLDLLAEVANRGNISSTTVSLVRFTDDAGIIAPDRSLGVVPPRYRGTSVVTTTWTRLIGPTAVVTVSVDPAGFTPDVERLNDTRRFSLTFSADTVPQPITFEPRVPMLISDSVTVKARVSVVNPGNIGVLSVTIQFVDGAVSSGQAVPGSDALFVPFLPGGGGVVHTQVFTATSPGWLEIGVRASSPTTVERYRSDKVLIARSRLFLPVILAVPSTRSM